MIEQMRKCQFPLTAISSMNSWCLVNSITYRVSSEILFWKVSMVIFKLRKSKQWKIHIIGTACLSELRVFHYWRLSRKYRTNICPGRFKESCLQQGIELEDNQDAFQLYDSVLASVCDVLMKSGITLLIH